MKEKLTEGAGIDVVINGVRETGVAYQMGRRWWVDLGERQLPIPDGGLKGVRLRELEAGIGRARFLYAAPDLMRLLGENPSERLTALLEKEEEYDRSLGILVDYDPEIASEGLTAGLTEIVDSL